MREISPGDLKAWLEDPERERPRLLDVREPREFDICKLEGSLLMPVASVPERYQELDKDEPVVVICHMGIRSVNMAGFLESQGFTQVINLTGGLSAWRNQVDPQMPTY